MVIEQVRVFTEQVRAVYKTGTVTDTGTDSLTSIIECMWAAWTGLENATLTLQAAHAHGGC